MEIDVRCFCGQAVQVTPLPAEDDYGVYVPFNLSHRREHIDQEDLDSVWHGVFGRAEGSVTCKCGNTTHVVVKIDVVERQEPVSGDGTNVFHQLFEESFGGKQVHATEHGSREQKRDTYLYKDDRGFRFEQYVGNQNHDMLQITSEESREHVAKLLPVLFTPEELKKLENQKRGHD